MLRGFGERAAPQAPPSAVKSVLIIEDNPLNMKLFSAMLAAEGYLVLEAADAHSGVALAHARHPNLIIMDISLPGMSGIEAAQSLKADLDTSDIPIVVTTAYQKQYDEKIQASGCDAFMAKPISVTHFLDTVEMLAARPAPQPQMA